MKNLKMLSILAASVMFLGSCTDDQTDTSVVENPVKGGEEVLFGSSLSKSSQIETRTIYGDEVTGGGDYQHGYFPVYWEDGDNITILCPQASNGTRVEYTITPLEDDKTTSADVTKLDPNKPGLQWNGNVDEHEFFAFYPAGAIRGEAVPDDGIVTVNIPAEQHPVRWEKKDDNTWVGIANTDYAYMWAYNKVKKSETPKGTSIPLPFKPMTTVLEITVNGPKSGSQAVSQVTVTSVDPARADNPNTILSGEVKCNIRAAAEGGKAICEAAGNMNEVRNRIAVNLYNAKGDGKYPTLSAGEKLKVYVSIMPKDENIEKGNLKVTVAGVNTPAKEKTLKTATIIAHAINKVNLPALDATGTQTDINYWMSNLDPNIYLTELSWPGSKMSAITYEKGVDDVLLIGEVHNGYTQRNTLTQQFKLGVRAFDFPTVVSFNSIKLGRETYSSGTASIGTSLKEALDELAECLDKAEQAGKKQEAVFVNISYAASRFILLPGMESSWLSTLMSTFNDWKNNRICTSEVNANTTLGDVAGKIILRIHVKGEDVYNKFTTELPAQLVCYSSPYTGQLVPMSWGTASATNGLKLFYEDQTRLANGGFWDLTKNDGTPEDKKNNVASVLQESVKQYVNNTAHNIWYLIDLGGFYTTAILNISIYDGEAAAEELTPYFFKFFNTRTKNASLGVVYMNFADNLANYGAKYGCDQLIQTIINNNFTFQLRTRGSDSKKSPLMRGVSAGNDDPNSWD